MRLLLGSGGYRTPERIANFRTIVRDFLGSIATLLFVPYALEDHDAYVAKILERGLDAGYAIEGIHRTPDPVAAVQRAEAVFVGSGIFLSENPARRARAVVEAVTHWEDPKRLAEISK
ncbi:MAG TPA: Type 1 glutamine amidotransferase-like domain-containing protein, partial [Gemmatales bacterium]|nr:Type 1 glutamine amidotransferase-like domain-containing protein [Gemmatales bacterium]